MRCLKCVYNAKVAYVNLVMYCGAWFRSVYLEYIYPFYYMALLLTFINPLLLNGDSLGTSVIFGTHLNRIADCNINLSSSRKLTFMLPDSMRFKN